MKAQKILPVVFLMSVLCAVSLLTAACAPEFPETIVLVYDSSKFHDKLSEELESYFAESEYNVLIHSLDESIELDASEYGAVVVMEDIGATGNPVFAKDFRKANEGAGNIVWLFTHQGNEPDTGDFDAVTKASIPAEIPPAKDMVVERLESILE
jgi:hypothetical protein